MSHLSPRYALALAAMLTVLCAGCATQASSGSTPGATASDGPRSPAQLKAQSQKPS